MKNSAKLTLRMSEIRVDINNLPPGEESIAKRKELLGHLNTAEVEFRAAVTAEAEADATAPDANGLSPEEREIRQLEQKAELRGVVNNMLRGREPEGAELEFQRAKGLSGTELPWEMIAPRARDMRGVEHRVDAVTPAPGTTQDNQRTPLGRVFARSATMTLGVEMPQVPTGDLNVPVLTGSQSATNLSKDASVGDAAAGTLTAVTFTPTRIQFEYIMRREDRARMLGLDEVLRRDLSSAIADQVDAQVLVGDGSAPNFGGFLAAAASGGLPAVAAPTTTVDYSLALAQLVAGVDGEYAGSIPECSAVIGDDSYRKLATLVNSGSGETAAGTYHRMLMGFMASSNVTAPASNDQEGIIAKRGAGANAICPMWGGVQILVDEVSSANRKKGWISLTAVLLSDFKITRKDGFQRIAFQLA